MDEIKNLDSKHRKSLNQAREIISHLIDEVSLFSDGTRTKELDTEYWNLMWGDKENITSVINKLTTILLKIIPIEQDLNSKEDQSKSVDAYSQKIDESDRKIIKRYIKKFSQTSQNK